MANDVQIILTAVDKASAVLKKTDTATQSLGQTLKTVATSAAVAAAAYKGFEILKSTVVDTVAYAESVRDLSRALGISAEESSTLIQVADDLKIDIGTLKMGFKKALMEGVQPNIEGIKGLAKEYQQLTSPVDKAQFSMKYFGRAGLELNKILELTPAQIDAMAKSAEDAGLILSGESVQSARDYEIALDGLDDTVMGLKISIGNQLIPVLANLATGLSEYIVQAQATSDLTEQASANVDEYSMRYVQLHTRVMEQVVAENALTDAQIEAAGVSYENVIAREKMKAATEDLTEVVDAATIAADLEKQKTEELSQKLADLKNLIAGPVGDEYDRFKQKSGELKDKQEELRAKIEELEGMEYITPEQKAELDSLYIEIGEVSTQMTANADAHDEATKRILYNLLQQQLAIGGWTDDELLLLTEVGNRWGLIDDKTAEATTGMAAALKEFSESGDLAHFMWDLDNIKKGVDNIPREITIKVKINTDDPDNILKKPGRQFGGPVSAGVPYLVGEGGPEMFVPSSSGTIINNYNLTAMYQQRDRQSLAMDIKMLAAMYG